MFDSNFAEEDQVHSVICTSHVARPDQICYRLRLSGAQEAGFTGSAIRSPYAQLSAARIHCFILHVNSRGLEEKRVELHVEPKAATIGRLLDHALGAATRSNAIPPRISPSTTLLARASWPYWLATGGRRISQPLCEMPLLATVWRRAAERSLNRRPVSAPVP